MFYLLLLIACESPCDAYAEDAFWSDIESVYCERNERCEFERSCAETRDYLAYQRQELADCGATFDGCAGKEHLDAAATSCDAPSLPKLFGEVYTPECPLDTGR